MDRSGIFTHRPATAEGVAEGHTCCAGCPVVVPRPSVQKHPSVDEAVYARFGRLPGVSRPGVNRT